MSSSLMPEVTDVAMKTCVTVTSRSPSGNGSGRSSPPYATAAAVIVAPVPTANTTTATIEDQRPATTPRQAKRRSEITRFDISALDTTVADPANTLRARGTSARPSLGVPDTTPDRAYTLGRARFPRWPHLRRRD